MTSTHWIKIYYIIGSIVFLFYFDLLQFLLAFLAAWVLSGITVSVILHRQISHRQFEYKNNFFKFLSYIFIVISGQGSPLGWAAVHRQHHKYSDRENDPQNPNIVGKWRTMLSWYKLDTINHRQLIDLLRNKELMYLHNHTGMIFLMYSTLIWILLPSYALSITAVVPFLCSLWVGYVNTVAHDSSINYEQNKAKNIDPQLLLWGESYHKTHHLNSALIKMGTYDLGYYVINFISKKN